MKMADGVGTWRAGPGGGRIGDQRRRSGSKCHALAGGPAPGPGRPGVRRGVGGARGRQRVHRRERRRWAGDGPTGPWSSGGWMPPASRGRERPGTPACGRPEGDLLAFCDADDVVQPGWLSAVASALEDADVAAGVFDFWSLNGRPASTLQPAATWQLGFLPAGLGANLGVRRHAFEEVGGFAGGAVDRRGHRLVLAAPAPGVPLRGGLRRGGGQARAPRLRDGVPARNGLRAQRPHPLPPSSGRRRPARSERGGQIVALVDRPSAAPPEAHRPA